jgi:hypothetical protein
VTLDFDEFTFVCECGARYETAAELLACRAREHDAAPCCVSVTTVL